MLPASPTRSVKSYAGNTVPSGLELRQVRVPFGVVAMIYEARPNVTADAAGICLKSGNASLLRGSSSAFESNTEIVSCPARRPRTVRVCRPMRSSSCPVVAMPSVN